MVLPVPQCMGSASLHVGFDVSSCISVGPMVCRFAGNRKNNSADDATAESYAKKGRCSDTDVKDDRQEPEDERLFPRGLTATLCYDHGPVLPPRWMPSPARQGHRRSLIMRPARLVPERAIEALRFTTQSAAKGRLAREPPVSVSQSHNCPNAIITSSNSAAVAQSSADPS